MDKKNYFSLISDLKYENSKKAFLELKNYISSMDLNIDSKWKRKVIKSLIDIPEPYRNDLTSVLEKSLKGPYLLLDEIGFKESAEAKYFSEIVSEITGPVNILYDLCCGNGVNGYYWLHNEKADFVHFYDIKINSNFENIRSRIKNYEYHVEDIFRSNIGVEEDSLITSIHACGNLTDKVIDISIKNNAYFAVLPCCYSKKDNLHFSESQLDYFNDYEDAIDVSRILKARSRGYKIKLRKIPSDISDKNRIIIGISYD